MRFVFLFCFFTTHSLLAQFTDDFADGNLRMDPAWQGDTAIFSVLNSQLKLVAPAVAGKAMLATRSTAVSGAFWELKISLDFNPSSSNYVRIYLVADRPQINDQLNGYYIEAGNTGDDVSLYRQSGATSIKIIDGVDGRLNYSSVQVTIRAETDTLGNWSLYSDTGPAGPTGVFLKEGTAHDLTHTTSDWFMMECVFTSTRSDKFHFDDIRVEGRLYPDYEAPFVEYIRVPTSEKIELKFSEQVNTTGLTNFMLLNEQGNQVQSIENTGGLLELNLSSKLNEGKDYQLKITGVTDRAGNLMQDTVFTFNYYLPRAVGFRDVLFTEILADPDPAVADQFPEYVEIYNRSDFAVNLNGWLLTDHTTISVLPDFTLLPDSYVVIGGCSVNFPSAVSNKICLQKFPSLNNSGDRLLLIDSARTVIDSVNYQSNWHAVADKASGGWSLELIDPGNICQDSENWTSSVNIEGGTPGRSNSVKASLPDVSGPLITATEVISNKAVQISFSERLEMKSMTSQNISIDPSSVNYNFSWLGAGLLRLDFESALSSDQIYNIKFKDLSDCLGNRTENKFIGSRILISSEPDSTSVIINEILFNPHPGGTDYIELYNVSGGPINLKNWSVIKDKNSVGAALVRDFIFYPGAYLVLTADRKILNHQFPMLPDSLIIEYPLPSLPDDEGVVMLLSPSGRLIDSLFYESNFHLRLIKDDEGISLERLSVYAPTSSRDNWMSAGLNGGSPGHANALQEGIFPGSGFQVEPEAFSCGSGNCFTRLNYDLNRPEMMINLSVFNTDGFLVKMLCRNEHISGKGFIRWDGDDSEGKFAAAGIYIFQAEIFDATGYFKIFRNRVIIMPESQ
jgi:hypothetical protein